MGVEAAAALARVVISLRARATNGALGSNGSIYMQRFSPSNPGHGMLSTQYKVTSALLAALTDSGFWPFSSCQGFSVPRQDLSEHPATAGAGSEARLGQTSLHSPGDVPAGSRTALHVAATPVVARGETYWQLLQGCLAPDSWCTASHSLPCTAHSTDLPAVCCQPASTAPAVHACLTC